MIWSFLILSTILSISPIDAQNLQDHKWKNRILLVVADEINSSAFQNQLDELNKIPKEIKERKLVIYGILPEQYFIMNSLMSDGYRKWKKSTLLYDTYGSEKASFRVILIGLDGGKKHSQTTQLSNQDLIGIIDSMPMRAAEIRRGY
jgi:hypothetical protein